MIVEAATPDDNDDEWKHIDYRLMQRFDPGSRVTLDKRGAVTYETSIPSVIPISLPSRPDSSDEAGRRMSGAFRRLRTVFDRRPRLSGGMQ